MKTDPLQLCKPLLPRVSVRTASVLPVGIVLVIFFLSFIHRDFRDSSKVIRDSFILEEVQMNQCQCLKCCKLTQCVSSPRNSSASNLPFCPFLLQRSRRKTFNSLLMSKYLCPNRKKKSRLCEHVPGLHPPVLATQQVGRRLPLSSPICQKQPPEPGRGLLVHLESLQNSSQTHPEAHMCSVRCSFV